MAKMAINGQTFEGSVDELVELIAKMDAKGSSDLYIRTPGEVRLTDECREELYKSIRASGGYEYLPKLSPDSTVNFDGGVSTGIYIRPKNGGEVRITTNGDEKTYVVYGNKFVETPVGVHLEKAQPETITHDGVEYKRVDREAREGDVVMFTETTSAYVDNKTPYVVDSGMRVMSGWPVYNDLANRTPSNVKVYEPIVAKPEPLQVGDYAKVVKVADSMVGFNLGNVIEVVHTKCTGTNPIAVKSPKGIEGYGSEGVHLVRATDEEVAEAKRQAAEKAVADKWADIGRKPNEFKVGDIVRIVASDSTQPNGTLGEVGELDGKDSFRVLSPGFVKANWQGPDTVELITPVEHRFDLPGGDSE